MLIAVLKNICVASNQIKSNLFALNTHISMQQVVKAVDERANKAQKSTYSDPKTTS